MKKNGGVGRERMTGPRQYERELLLSEIDTLKERMRAGEKLGPKQVATELRANPIAVQRILKTLRWLNKMKGTENEH